MHIPDGFLDAKTLIGTAAISGATLGYGLAVAGRRLDDRQVPATAMLAAFIFAAQMVNFPIAGGTSGHLIGGALAAMLIGPWGGMVSMATVVIIQALFFSDGGITALGANLLNMAVLAPFVGYGVYRLLAGPARLGGSEKPAAPWRSHLAGFIAAWVSVMVAAAAASLELALSGVLPLSTLLAPMLGWHALIGVGEGVLTAIIVSYAWRVRPVRATIQGEE